jgi:hypothetical protein
MISFSVSTIRKNATPPSRSQGQTYNGMASVSNSTWNGDAYVSLRHDYRGDAKAEVWVAEVRPE